MSKNLPLGEIITTEQHRDAIHVAVAPVEAGERLTPGTHVTLRADGKAVSGAATIGIVDPFLRQFLMPGDRFWLFLYPNTITSLRHDWSHPSFPVCCREDDLSRTPELTPFAESERWMREYVKGVCPYDSDELDNGYAKFVENARRGAIYYHGCDLHGASELHAAADLFRHLSVILGKPVSAESFDYSCSC